MRRPTTKRDLVESLWTARLDITIMTYLATPENRSNFGSSERKTHVSGMGGSDGVHGQTTSFVGGSSKGGHLVGGDLGAHLQRSLRMKEIQERVRNRNMTCKGIVMVSTSQIQRIGRTWLVGSSQRIRPCDLWQGHDRMHGTQAEPGEVRPSTNREPLLPACRFDR